MRAFPHPVDALDREFAEHLVYVFNQSVQAVRKTGLTEQSMEKIGKMGLRLYSVFGAYKVKKTEYTPSQWLTKADEIAKELIDGLS